MAQPQEPKTENAKCYEDVIYPEIEPGIINKEMIENAYLNDGKAGVAARLHQQEPVILERISVLRLEFLNILRLDHLWIVPNLTKLSLNNNRIETIENIEMLTSLKELDLSFNYIEKIENLDKLVNLEVLTLFNNLIEKIENIDALENLVILSLGNNNINTIDGIERLRFFKKLRVLNLEGNPLAKRTNFCLSMYIAAVLPNLKYYEYARITDDVRQEDKELFTRELRELEINEENELSMRAQKEKEKLDTERFSLSFVEHLNEHQLYESLWKGDEDGRVLLMIGQPALDLAEEYDKDIFDLTQELFKLGLERYEERQEEINEFMENLQDGLKEVQTAGQGIVEDFLKYKEKILEEAGVILREIEKNTAAGDDEDSPENQALLEKYDNMMVEFDDTVNYVWQQLMAQELHLHEAIEESTVNIQRRIQEMLGKFVEQAQSYFSQLRDVGMRFSENMSEIASRYVGTVLALQDFTDVPPELLACMEDREAVGNLIVGMKDAHSQRIDEREDRLMNRTKEFIDNFVGDLAKEELERNRNKVLEINSFLEQVADSVNRLHMEIQEEMLNKEE